MSVAVFCGPTLSVDDVRAVLPDALCLPPARCGDVLLALRLEPRALLLVDGVFERSGSVWHKELLLAIERGVRVYGAASMGALRASELDRLGMIGVGEVYRRYAAGELRDDDEVAVVHAPSGDARSDAMVDLRATIASAVNERVLARDQAAALIDAAKRLFYPQRTIEQAAARAGLSDFARWARRRWVSLKRRDAEQALRRVADDARATAANATPAHAQQVPRTGNLRELWRHASLAPFRRFESALPEAERVAQAARLVGRRYVEAKRVARLLACVADLAGADNCSTLDELERCTSSLVARLPPSQRVLFGVARYQRWLRALGPTSPASAELTARLLRAIDRAAAEAGVTPRPVEVKELLHELRLARGLLDSAALAQWRAEHGLESDAELGALLSCCYRERALAHGHVVAAPRISSTVWLHVGLALCGVTDDARAVMRGEREPVLPTTLGEAIDRDFDDEHDASRFAAEVR